MVLKNPATFVGNNRTELCRFSGQKIYPGRGIRFIRSDSQVFLFANSKCKRYFHNKLKPSKLGLPCTKNNTRSLSPCIVDLDDHQTSMHVWAPNHRRCNKPNLVLVHGYGGNSKWQFVLQVAQLTRDFNVYIPDLVFFGKSYSTRSERTDVFQAKCVCDGMRKLGVERFSVYGLSYGGYVVYRMAAMEEKMVEKVVIVSSGIVYTESQKSELLKKVGRNVVDVLVPEKPEEIRTLCRMSMYKFDVGKLFPDFFLRGFIAADGYKKEKQQLVEHLLLGKPDVNLPVLTQETLLIWGDKDQIFPIQLANQLHSHLGPKSKLEILKNVGHAANIEAPYTLNKLVTLFISP